MIIKSLLIFLLTGLCKISGGYLVWLWLKEGKPYWYGLLGGVILVLYGVVATLHTSNVARVYATYGRVFVMMSLLSAYKFDNYQPDKYDIIGALVTLLVVSIIYYAKR